MTEGATSDWSTRITLQGTWNKIIDIKAWTIKNIDNKNIDNKKHR